MSAFVEGDIEGAVAVLQAAAADRCAGLLFEQEAGLTPRVSAESTGRLKILPGQCCREPWIARSSPRFFRGLATLWNNTLSKNPHLKLFVAGSATSWMIDHVIQARTGLAKRVTAKIHMRSLDLAQTRQFLAAKGINLSHDEVFRIYCALGGIPYYLDVHGANRSAAGARRSSHHHL
jgi:hypothetical protein